MTAAVVLGWAVVGLLFGHLLDRVVRRAAAAEARTLVAIGTPVPVGRPGASMPAVPVPAAAGPGGSAGPPDDVGGRVVPLDRHLRSARGGALVPVLAATGCLLAGARFGTAAAGLPFLVLVPLLAELAVVDSYTRRLPNALTLPALPVGVALVAAVAVLRGRPTVLLGALLAAVLLFLVLLGLAVARPAGMGMGDVKAAAVIGLYVGSLGVGPALAAVVVASAAAFAGGVLLMALGRIGARTATPFGPWLALGALVAVLAGPQLVAAYLDLVG